MSSYTTTATVTGEPQVRRNPTGGHDLRGPDLVEVARNGLETEARDVVRITVITNTGTEATAYLTREAAEELATEVLRAADLIAEDPQPEPRLAGGIGSMGTLPVFHPRATDRALRVVERAVAEATTIGVLRSELLGRIANGLTGRRSGYRERLLARAMGDAIDPILDLTDDEAKVADEARRQASMSARTVDAELEHDEQDLGERADRLRAALSDVLRALEDPRATIPANRLRSYRVLAGRPAVVDEPSTPQERAEEGIARAAARWTDEEVAQVDAAIRTVAARRRHYADEAGREFTTAHVWAELGPGFPVTKGIAGRMLAAKGAGLIENTGRTTILDAAHIDGPNHGQRLTVWRAL